MHKEHIHPSRIAPYIIDAIMELDFPAFRVHGSDIALNVSFAEIERGEDVSEKFHKLRWQLMAAFNNKHFGVMHPTDKSGGLSLPTRFWAMRGSDGWELELPTSLQ